MGENSKPGKPWFVPHHIKYNDTVLVRFPKGQMVLKFMGLNDRGLPIFTSEAKSVAKDRKAMRHFAWLSDNFRERRTEIQKLDKFKPEDLTQTS